MKLYTAYTELPVFVESETNFHKRYTKSYGLAVKSRVTGREVKVRKHYTHNFMKLFRGTYYQHDLRQIIENMTGEEYKLLTDCLTNRELFNNLCEIVGKNNDLIADWNYARLLESSSLLLSCKPLITDVPLFYPKGQRSKETELACAFREFSEETGVNLLGIEHTVLYPSVEYKRNDGYTDIIFFVEVEEEFEVRTLDTTEIYEVVWA